MFKIISAIAFYIMAFLFVGCTIDTVDKVVGSKGEKFVYRINSNKCSACANCVSRCPENAISEYQVDKTTWAYIVDPSKCTGCGICLSYCEDDAIQPAYYKE